MPNPYRPGRAKLWKVTTETPTIKTFALAPEGGLEFEAGQFVEVTVPGLGEAPFTPSSSPSRSDELEVTVMNAGSVTAAMHGMDAPAQLGVRGPFGNAYPLEEYEGRDLLVMGGGVGLAPLRSLLYALVEERDRFGRIILCYGARSPADIVYRDEVRSWQSDSAMEVHLTVDNADESWAGKVGVVTTTLEDVSVDTPRAAGIVCGPPIMMKFATMALLEKGFRPESLYLSMERNMSCGIGKCGHCRIGEYYVCRDGPVFTYAQLEDIEDLW